MAKNWLWMKCVILIYDHNVHFFAAAIKKTLQNWRMATKRPSQNLAVKKTNLHQSTRLQRWNGIWVGAVTVFEKWESEYECVFETQYAKKKMCNTRAEG